MAHEHPIIDADKHFTIDPTTRKIMPEKPDKANLVQFDHNSERLTFELPRFIDGHDMLTCNEVWVHFNNIDINTKETNHGVYQVTDLQVSEGQEDTLVCSWLVSQEGTQLVGLLSFVVSFMCAPADGAVEYRWNTAPYTGISVLNGIFNSNIVLEEYADILIEWEERIRAMEEGGGAALSDDLPLADGEASSGESKEAARADHVHPFTGMPAPSDIEFVAGFDDRDNVIFERNGTARKTSFDFFKQVLAYSLSRLYDSVGEHYASLKELSGDTTLLTEEDRAGIVSEAQGGITVHNTSDTAHNDIRLLIEGLASRLNALADSDDTTLDQLSELVAYIKANRGLIEGVTTAKVNVSDIIDNLTTNTTDKPLSAAQGVAIKALIDALSTGKLDTSVFNDTMANHYNKTQVEAYVQEYAQPKGEGDVDEAVIEQIVQEWLNEHPEATTTIQDGSVTPEKTSFITSEVVSEGHTEIVPDYTNLADPTSSEWVIGKTMSVSVSDQYDDMANSHITNKIYCTKENTIRITGFNVSDLNSLKIRFFQSDGSSGFNSKASKIARADGNLELYTNVDKNELANGVYCINLMDVYNRFVGTYTKLNLFTYVQVCGIVDNVDDIIITVDEPIVNKTIVTEDVVETVMDDKIVVPLAKENKERLDTHHAMLSNMSADAPEIIMPYELAVAVGVECNIFKENIVFSSRSLDNYSIRAELTGGNGAEVKNYPDFFRITASEGQEGDYTFIVSLHDKLTNAVVLKKSAVMHIVPNTDYTASPKKVLFIGDSVTASYKGVMMAEIQYILSDGGIVSIGTQESAADDLGYEGSVQHEGYNSAAAYSYDPKWDYDAVGFTRQYITKTEMDAGRVNPFWNPDLDIPSFDLGYYMEKNKFTQLDAVCINLGLNSMGAHDQARRGLNELVEKIRDYNKNLPIIISMCTQLATGPEARTDVVANRIQWKGLQKTSVLEQFDGGKVPGVYISTPYMALDMNRYYKTFEEPRSARDPEKVKVLRRSETDSSADYYHPIQIGVEMLADAYYPWILYALGNT